VSTESSGNGMSDSVVRGRGPHCSYHNTIGGGRRVVTWGYDKMDDVKEPIVAPPLPPLLPLQFGYVAPFGAYPDWERLYSLLERIAVGLEKAHGCCSKK